MPSILFLVAIDGALTESKSWEEQEVPMLCGSLEERGREGKEEEENEETFASLVRKEIHAMSCTVHDDTASTSS